MQCDLCRAHRSRWPESRRARHFVEVADPAGAQRANNSAADLGHVGFQSRAVRDAVPDVRDGSLWCGLVRAVSTARHQVAVAARWLPGLGRRLPGVGSWHWIKLALRLITRRAKKDHQVDLESAGGGDVEIEETAMGLAPGIKVRLPRRVPTLPITQSMP